VRTEITSCERKTRNARESNRRWARADADVPTARTLGRSPSEGRVNERRTRLHRQPVGLAEVRAVKTTTGSVDIVLRLDGTYSNDALDDPGAVEELRRRLLQALAADGVSETAIARGRLLRP
jgi:hypothetical protein